MERNKSIITNDLSVCYICGAPRECIHKALFGSANRKKSIEDGLYIGLCNYHHNTSKNGVHLNRELDLKIKRDAQKAYEKTHTREEFIRRYGKSWL